MEWSLILLIIGIILVIYLIFKFITKIVFAIITTFIFFLVIIGSMFGLVYLDYNYLTSQQDYTVKIVHEENGVYTTGIDIPVVNGSMDMNSIAGIDKEFLEKVDSDEIDSDSGVILIVIDDSLFEELVEEEVYQLDVPGSNLIDIDLSLNGSEIVEIFDSETPREELRDIIIESNNLTGIQETLAKPIIDSSIESFVEETDLTVKESVLSFVIQDAIDNEANAILLVENFKDGDLEVYPDRFTLKLIRWLVPTSFITDKIEEVEE